MSFIIIILCILLLILLITYFKVDTFISFIIVSVIAAISLEIPLADIPSTVNRGLGNILSELTIIIVLGAMLGKLVAESGAAEKMASVMIGIFGTKNIKWGLTVTGFIVGIPLFYGVGFILLVPIIFSIAYRYKLPAVYIGLPMLAALSVAHGFLPPSPSPVALTSMFKADLGMVLIYGIIISIPAIILGGPIYSRTLKKIKTGEIKLFQPKEIDPRFSMPGKVNSFATATLPVFLLILVTLIPFVLTMNETLSEVYSLVSAPTIVMLIALIVSTYTLGLRQGRTMAEVMDIYADSVKDIAMIILIIAGSGIFKQVMEDSGVSAELARSLQNIAIHPLILGWMIAAILRGLVGSATVAALTAAGVIMPIVGEANVNPALMVLSLGSGSLMFSHVNDSGFWLFKEYFNLSIKDTLRSWSVMEIIVSVVGLIGIMILNIFV